MNRDQYLQQIGDQGFLWDLIIIGGGATGLGAAVDAASRGYKTLLLEQADFAKGTSSRSTKLIHGGVRYLRQGQISLVRESLRERGLLLRHGPHLVHQRPFIVPCYGRWESVYYGLGLRLYDVLAGRLGLGTSQHLSRDAALRQVPTLEPHGLRSGVLYFDGQFDDARLAISLAQTAADLGGVPLNYVQVVGFEKSGDRITGVRAIDTESGREYAIASRAVINATGIFGNDVLRLDDPGAAEILVTSQGIHLVLDKAFLPGDAAIMIPHTDDGRVLFAVPWLGKVIVGTTDTLVPTPSLEPRALEPEIDFVLTHARRYLACDPSRSDILSVFAGLRPLVRSGKATRTPTISRDYLVMVSRSGLVSVTGGKWTIYRRMGEAVVERALRVAGLAERPSRTRDLPIHGWLEPEATTLEDPLHVYGSEAHAIHDLIKRDPELGEPLHPRLPYLKAQALWAAHHEAARTLEDLLARRTRCLFLDARTSIEAAPAAATLLAQALGRDPAWAEEQTRQFTELAKGYLAPVPAG
jgi:glycerol-3-phosphate dehydrogenase